MGRPRFHWGSGNRDHVIIPVFRRKSTVRTFVDRQYHLSKQVLTGFRSPSDGGLFVANIEVVVSNVDPGFWQGL